MSIQRTLFSEREDVYYDGRENVYIELKYKDSDDMCVRCGSSVYLQDGYFVSFIDNAKCCDSPRIVKTDDQIWLDTDYM